MGSCEWVVCMYFLQYVQMQMKQLRLRVVGGRGTAKRSPTLFQQSNLRHRLLGQQKPGVQSISSIQSDSSLASLFQKPNKSRSELLLNQNPMKTRFIQDKMIVIDKFACLLTTLIFFLSAAKTEVDVTYRTPYRSEARYLMYSLSLCVTGLAFIVLLRHLSKFQLEVCQNKVYYPKDCRHSYLVGFFKYSSSVRQLIIQVLIISAHPLPSLVGQTYQLQQTYDEIHLRHSYNDLLSLFLGLKIYIIIRALISLTSYASPRASRLCHQNAIEHNLLFVVKGILQQHPLTAIAIAFGILIGICGYCLKLTEGMVFLYNNDLTTGFQSYDNCFWTIFITMSTVGYGDYYPKTLLGRAIMLITAILGVFLTSLLIVSLSLYLKMTSSETNSHLLLDRLRAQEFLQRVAASAVSETIRINHLRREHFQYQQVKESFGTLKLDLDRAKSKAREIKSLINTDNMVEEMNRLFYILKDNFKDIFLGQAKLKAKIEKMGEVQQIKLNFIKQVSQMLSRPSGSIVYGS